MDPFESYEPYVPNNIKAIQYQGIIPRPPSKIEPLEHAVGDTVYRTYLTLENTDNGDTVKLPFTIEPYKQLSGTDLLDNIKCSETMRDNYIIEKFNKFIINIVQHFTTRYKCGVSRRVPTLPEDVPDFEELRTQLKNETMGNKNTDKMAVEYLALRNYYPLRDYDMDKVIEKANDVSFDEYVTNSAKEQKRVRVQNPGKPSTWWYCHKQCDEQGTERAWIRGPNHTFLMPDCRVGVIE